MWDKVHWDMGDMEKYQLGNCIGKYHLLKIFILIPIYAPRLTPPTLEKTVPGRQINILMLDHSNSLRISNFHAVLHGSN
jgi:hypothetical protein